MARASTPSTSSRPRSSTSSSAVARRPRSGSATSRASTSADSSSGSRSATSTARGRRSSPRSSTTSRSRSAPRALASRHRARQPGVPPGRGDARLHAPDLRPRDRPRGAGDGGPLLAGARDVRRGASATARPPRATDPPRMPADYRFLTTWLFESPRERVWDAIFDQNAWPSWWRGVEAVTELAPGDDTGVGSHSRLVWRSKLPYDLVFGRRRGRWRSPADRGRRLRRAQRHRALAAVRAGRGHRGALRVERAHDEAVDERAGAAAGRRSSRGTTTG